MQVFTDMKRSMDPIWRLLPYELVLRICNMLTRVRRVPLYLKEDIEFQEHKLLRVYRASAAFFHWPWTDVYNSLAVYCLQKGCVRHLEDGWDAQHSSYNIWAQMTHEERDDFTTTWHRLVNVSQSYPSIRF